MVDEVGFFLDYSHLDFTAFGSDDEHAVVEAVRQGTVKRTNDGIIAATTARSCDVLVTENVRDFRNAGVPVRTFADFRAWLVSEAATL